MTRSPVDRAVEVALARLVEKNVFAGRVVEAARQPAAAGRDTSTTGRGGAVDE
jgi:hypothetical protein